MYTVNPHMAKIGRQGARCEDRGFRYIRRASMCPMRTPTVLFVLREFDIKLVSAKVNKDSKRSKAVIEELASLISREPKRSHMAFTMPFTFRRRELRDNR